MKKTIAGNRIYYNADQGCPIFPELKSILLKTVGIVNSLQDCLKPLSKRILIAFIYGSVAAGTEDSESDIDLFIVGNVKLLEVARLIKSAERQLLRSINPVIMSTTEAKRRLKEKHHFIESVRKSPKLFLKGKDSELGKIFS